MSGQEWLDQLRALFTEKRVELMRESGRLIPDNEFAVWLGVSPASFNAWINGSRKPSRENAELLARKLGVEVFHALGYTPIYEIDDELLQKVVSSWRYLDARMKQEVYESVTKQRTGEAARRG